MFSNYLWVAVRIIIVKIKSMFGYSNIPQEKLEEG
jgi:hypothetical protein